MSCLGLKNKKWQERYPRAAGTHLPALTTHRPHAGPLQREVGPWHCVCVLSHFRPVRLFATIAHQGPLSMGFSRQEYWSVLPCPPSEDLPYPRIEPVLPVAPTLQVDSLPLSHQWLQNPPGSSGQGQRLGHSQSELDPEDPVQLQSEAPSWPSVLSDCEHPWEPVPRARSSQRRRTGSKHASISGEQDTGLRTSRSNVRIAVTGRVKPLLGAQLLLCRSVMADSL